MANYGGLVRTNYFKVKDEEAFRALVSDIVGDEAEVVLIEDEDKAGFFGFYCESSLSGLRLDEPDENDCEFNTESVYDKLASLVADDDAVIITEIGNEKMRYLTAYTVVITSKETKFINLSDESIKLARTMLGNENWETKNEY